TWWSRSAGWWRSRPPPLLLCVVRDDLGHEPLQAGAPGVQVGSERAFVHDAQPVADPEEVLQAVRDEDHRDALRRDRLDQFEDGLDLGDGERRRGLVENEQL